MRRTTLPTPELQTAKGAAMDVDGVFVSLRAEDFAGLSAWWTRLLGRGWDREPMPTCREWDVAPAVRLQVLDDPDGRGTGVVTLHVTDLDAEIERLGRAGIAVPDPVAVDGFDTLRFAQFTDPEDNVVGLLDGR